MKSYIVALTGATGIIIGKRIAEILSRENKVYAIISEAAKLVAKYELNQKIFLKSKNIVIYNESDIDKNISSGTCKTEGMIIAPCSMKTVSAIANGFSHNLITRAADVCIKEKRKLVIVPRETPLSEIHLKNLLKLARFGVYVVPPLIQFYSAETKEELINYVCGKILDCFGINHKLYKEWNDN
ncbi:MAG: aromatic acid decarboxylase [Candidatus Aenigmatarchaeota archaeon]|nr:MAG: aromatic acid decarboxylase [Candidatus Aenigmarchaeota archaeon]